MPHVGLMALLLWIGLAAPRPPADGYPRQPLDVEHYRFAITLSDSSDRIEGVATVRMRLLAAAPDAVLARYVPDPTRLLTTDLDPERILTVMAVMLAAAAVKV